MTESFYRLFSSRHWLRGNAALSRMRNPGSLIPVFGYLLLTVFIAPTQVAHAGADFYPAERIRFVEARKALAERDLATFNTLKAGLTDYPLYRYLVFEQLRQDFDDNPGKSSVKKLNQFETDFKDEALTKNLTQVLQKSLIEAKEWSLFLGVSKSRLASPMLCSVARARYETGQLLKHQFDESMTTLWISPRKRPELCAKALEVLESRAKPGIAALWEKIYAAIEANKPAVAKPLLAQLASKDRKQTHRWLKAMDNPSALLKSDWVAEDTLLNRKIILDLVWRWSKNELSSAIQHWQSVSQSYQFYKDERYELTRMLALRAAYRRVAEAPGWLNSFQVRDDDLEIMEWRIRASLLAQDWEAVLKLIKALPAEEREEDHWAYWEARSLEETGAPGAEAIYEKLAELQSYHGFLSADRLGRPYNLYDQAIDVDPALVAELAIRPELIRAREFHHTEVSWEGRREWATAMADFKPEELKASAVLAANWGMADRAIISAGRAEERRALSYRFPVMFEQQVIQAARDTLIEPAVIYGVMRRESGFVPDIRSGAGAIGLMQLMPGTAKQVARMKGKKNWQGDLTEAALNIEFGSYYLRYVLDRFDDQLILGLASYNAGPHRVDKWLPQARDMAGDLWVDTIPYSETRRYVRAVLAYALIFEWRLTGNTTPITNRLNDVSVVITDAKKAL